MEIGNESEANQNPEALRVEIENKVEKLLGKENYGGLDLEASFLESWKDRPVLDQSKEPLAPSEDIRVILTAHPQEETRIKKGFFRKTEEAKKIFAYKTVQLHVTPQGEQGRVRHVYILNLTEGESPKLISYLNKPATPEIGGEPNPMLPSNTVTTEASFSDLKAFNSFLDHTKPLSSNS